jgi:hypothetical protein
MAGLAVLLGVGGSLPMAAGAAADPQTVMVKVDPTPIGDPMVSGFVGVSMEYKAVQTYAGSDPRSVDPVLIQLLAGLAPGQHPVLRIGGDSTDSTWWPVRGTVPPRGVSYALNARRLETIHALADALHGRLLMGINLAMRRPGVAAVEAQQILKVVGRRNLEAVEIGNEPDLYGLFPWFRNKHGRPVFARPSHYDVGAFIRDFSRFQAGLPVVPFAGPAFAGLSWMPGLGRFLSAEPSVTLATFHRYPLRACLTDPTSSGYASIPNLMADSSSAGLAAQVAPYVTVARSHGVPFRLDEMNSAACRGRSGVSDTFASALWALDTLFNLASAGVDGVNFHTLPGAAYSLFTITHSAGVWRAFVHPDYYGLIAFAQSFPPGARLLSVSSDGPAAVKVWATLTRSGGLNVMLINKDPSSTVQVQLELPGPQTSALTKALVAPSLSATTGVTFGGQTFGNSTARGRLFGRPQAGTVNPFFGRYTVTLPAASALLLTK